MRFYCYRYQIPNDYSCLNTKELSSESLTAEEAKAEKNKLFAKYIEQLCPEMENISNKQYIYKIEAERDSIFFIKIGKKGSVNLKDSTLDNKQKAEHYNQQSLMIIDNSSDNQVIAFQQTSYISFSNVKTLFFAQILKKLNATFLTLHIEPISTESKFWDTVDKYKDNITDLYFSVHAKNMPALTDDANEFISELRNQICAENTELHASSKSSLQIDSDNKYVKSMAESASLGLSKLKLVARTNPEDNTTAVVYDSSAEEIVDSFSVTHDHINKIIEASNSNLTDDIEKYIAVLKTYIKRHEIKHYE